MADTHPETPPASSPSRSTPPGSATHPLPTSWGSPRAQTHSPSTRPPQRPRRSAPRAHYPRWSRAGSRPRPGAHPATPSRSPGTTSRSPRPRADRRYGIAGAPCRSRRGSCVSGPGGSGCRGLVVPSPRGSGFVAGGGRRRGCRGRRGT